MAALARAGRLGRTAEALVIPIGALAVAMLVFGVFMAVLRQNPLEVYALIYRGGFASAFSWQNTLSRAAPLVLTALCVAVPAQTGLMVIGGEGALVERLREAHLGEEVGELARGEQGEERDARSQGQDGEAEQPGGLPPSRRWMEAGGKRH